MSVCNIIFFQLLLSNRNGSRIWNGDQWGAIISNGGLAHSWHTLIISIDPDIRLSSD